MSSLDCSSSPPSLDLTGWFATPPGRYVLDWEQDKFDNAVSDIFGFHAVQLGLPRIDFLRANRIPFRFTVGLEPEATVFADHRQLPFATSSVDLLVMPHILEFSADPHQILREVERVLMPEGQIIISGFNPFSLWGLGKKFTSSSQDYPWCGNYLSLLRLKDWLALLGFELNRGNFGCYIPPFKQERWLQRFSAMEKAGARWWPIAGGIYIIQAVKRTIGMRLVKPTWRDRNTARKPLVVPIPHRVEVDMKKETSEQVRREKIAGR